MQTTIRVHTAALSPQLLDGIRAMFPDQWVELIVRNAAPPAEDGSLADTSAVPHAGYSTSGTLYSLPDAERNSQLPAGNSGEPEADGEGAVGNKDLAEGNSRKVEAAGEVVEGNSGQSGGNKGDAAGNSQPAVGNNIQQRTDGKVLPTEEALLAALQRAFPETDHPTSLRGSARLLLHIVTQTRGNTGKLLAERSGFSYSGAAKHMMLLRKRGLVRRLGWQHYMVTELAVALIHEAMKDVPAS